MGGTVHTLEPAAEPGIATVLIEDGRITAVGADLELAPGIRRIDCTGQHIVPGLVDALVNFDADHDALHIRCGVTFLGDIGSDLDTALALREPTWRERTPGPAFTTAGAVLGGDPPLSPGALIVRHRADAEQLVAFLAENGVDALCLQAGLPGELWITIQGLARERGLPTMGPLPADLTLEEALAARPGTVHFLDGLLPRLPDGERIGWPIVLPRAFDGAIAALVAADSALVPVIGANAARLESPKDKMAALDLLAPHYGVWWGGEWAGRQRSVDEAAIADGRRALEKQMALVARLVEAGVRVVPGSGAPHPWLVPGDALHDEMALWVAAGIAPYEVLARATREGAKVLGVGAERGTLSPGKVADVLVVAGDPREGLASLRAPLHVVLRGRVLSRDTLTELVEGVRSEQAERRAKESAPLDIAPPVLPKTAAPLLAGEVETRALGQRVSGERWAVGREEDGALLFVGRVLRPAQGDVAASEIQVQQRLVEGRLAAFSVRLLAEGQEVSIVGALVGERLQMRREHNGVHIATENTDQPIVALSLGSLGGTATTPLVLGQRARQGRLWTLVLGALFEPAALQWEIVDQPSGRLVRTHSGGMIIEFEKNGALSGWAQEVGRSQLATLPRDATAFGGPGLLPLHDPAAGAAYVEAVRAKRDKPPEPVEDTGG
mgnify:CR=1 FL=1